MLTQTWAIFYDSYRELNNKKLFWVVLILSGLVVVACGVPYINEKGLWLLWWRVSDEPNTRWLSRALLYKGLFEFAIDKWLTLFGTVLALISVASIFPDFITGGAIELVLSKPISRLRLFLAKYVAGLLFVTLQTAIFTVASFLVMGIRGGVWAPGIFVAIPLVVLFFSYLFGVCVLLGTMTRSTIAALLLTLLFWVFLIALNFTDAGMLAVRANMMAEVELAERHAHDPPLATQPFATTEPQNLGPERIRTAATRPALRGPGPNRRAVASSQSHDPDRNSAPTPVVWSSNPEETRKSLKTITTVHRSVLLFKTFLPKTADTVQLLSRALTRAADLPREEPDAAGQTRGPFGMRLGERERLVGEKVKELTASRSLGWIIGTSLLFEAVTVGLAAWIFCRRDY